jgi:hypothetical protein
MIRGLLLGAFAAVFINPAVVIVVNADWKKRSDFWLGIAALVWLMCMVEVVWWLFFPHGD